MATNYPHKKSQNRLMLELMAINLNNKSFDFIWFDLLIDRHSQWHMGSSEWREGSDTERHQHL